MLAMAVAKDVLVNGNGGVFGAVARYGLATVLAVGMVIFLVTRVDAGLAQTLAVAQENKALLKEARTDMGKFVAAYEVVMQSQLRILRQTCVNTAKNDIQRIECLR